MAGEIPTRFIFVVALAFFATVEYVKSSPAIAPNYDQMGICIENCAQCKKMLGNWFDGQLCADFCIKFKGKIIPDCENLNSIAPFLNNV